MPFFIHFVKRLRGNSVHQKKINKGVKFVKKTNTEMYTGGVFVEGEILLMGI